MLIYILSSSLDLKLMSIKLSVDVALISLNLLLNASNLVLKVCVQLLHFYFEMVRDRKHLCF
jgi:hypothetical protein